MALRITKAADPITVEQIVACLYSAPGAGKTSLAFTADRPLLLDFDGGVYRAVNRKDAVQVGSWKDVANMGPSDLEGYRTVIVDTAGRALDALSVQLIAEDPKNATKSGALSLQGYGALKAAFTTWLSKLKACGVDVVLIAHMDEQRRGDEVIERLDVQGGSRNEIYKSADAMGRIYIDHGARILNFNPTDVAFGKNPGRLDALTLPNIVPGKESTFLADVLSKIKCTLNAEGEAVRAKRMRLDEVRAEFSKLDGAEAFNAAIQAHAKAEPIVKQILVEVGRGKGLEFDAKKKVFSAPEPVGATA